MRGGGAGNCSTAFAGGDTTMLAMLRAIALVPQWHQSDGSKLHQGGNLSDPTLEEPTSNLATFRDFKTPEFSPYFRQNETTTNTSGVQSNQIRVLAGNSTHQSSVVKKNRYLVTVPTELSRLQSPALTF
jgi:hypothetical protein